MDYKLLCYLMVCLLMEISKSNAEGVCNHQCIQSGKCNSKIIYDKCYYIFKDTLRKWNGSKLFCLKQNLSMVKVTREMISTGFNVSDLFRDLPAILFGNTQVYKNYAWLGGRAVDIGKWKFLNGTYLPDLDKSITQGIKSGERRAACGVLQENYGAFVLGLNYCFIENNFVCRTKSCSQNICLKYVEERKTWFKARSHCINLGGDLFYLKDGETWHSFTSVFNGSVLTPENPEVHIGLRHRLWEWIDESESEILYTNWNDYEPNTSSENCLTLDGNNGKWNDSKCDDFKLPFCQGALDETVTETPTTSESPPATKASTSKPAPSITEPIAPMNSKYTMSSGEMNSTTPPTALSPSSVMQTGKDKGVGVTPTYRDKTDSNASTSTPNATAANEFLPIVLGTLLSVVFIIMMALAIFITCRKCKKKSSEQDTEFIENNYYETSSEPVSQTPVVPASTLPYINSHVPVAEYTLCAVAEPDMKGSATQSSTKPVTKPKPIIGPKTGDVYSSVDKLNKTD